MKRLLTFFFGMILGAILMFGGLKFHFVQAADGFHVVSKTTAQLGSTYVDIRGFGLDDWERHPALMTALLNSDDDTLRDSVTNSTIDNTINNVLGGFGVGPTAK